ncbi:MAG: porin [Gammaproteobacteria bacterium]|nr:porin [Gammaproteobacteria bacterium]
MNRHLLSIAVCLGLVTAGTATTVCAQGADPAGDNPFARYLLDKGINLRGALIDQYARNPTGGVREGSANVGQFNIGLDLNLGKLVGLDGGSFHITEYRDYGNSFNQDVSGTFTKQQYIYKNPFPQWHLGLFAYEQKLLNDRLDILIGRLGTTTFYGHLTTNCHFVSGNLCGEPRIIVSEAGFSLLPSATWGTNIKFRPTAHTYVETGIFEVNPTTSASNGVHFSTADATGYTVPVELAWTNTDATATRYPFELKTGAYVSTAPLTDPYFNTLGLSRALHGGTARKADEPDRKGVYVMGDRAIWRPDPSGRESISVFAGAVQQLEAAEIARQQIYTGFIWTAPFKHRLQDTLGVSVSEFALTPGEQAYLRDARLKAGGTGSNAIHQIDYDVTYTWHVARGVELMPSIQYLMHPDNSTIPNTRVLPKNLLVWALGLRMDLGYIAGFPKTQSSD